MGKPSNPTLFETLRDDDAWVSGDLRSDITLRDLFAGLAAAGMWSDYQHIADLERLCEPGEGPEVVCRRVALAAYVQADAMLEAREK